MQHPMVRSRRLDLNAHDCSQFNCGVDELNHWLTRHAQHAAATRTASTFVWSRDGDVVGYYALAAHAIASAVLPDRVGHGAPDPVAAFLIGKLAVDVSLRGRGHLLMIDTLARCGVAARTGPSARLIVVDALSDEAADFYRRIGFVEVPDRDRTLVMKASTAERLVESFAPPDGG